MNSDKLFLNPSLQKATELAGVAGGFCCLSLHRSKISKDLMQASSIYRVDAHAYLSSIYDRRHPVYGWSCSQVEICFRELRDAFRIGSQFGSSRMKKVLSIDAGGTRGIIPAIILAEIEARAGQPISNLFDFFAGTSTGGMLVLGLNRPDPNDCLRPLCSATEVGWLFHEWANRAFGDKLSKTDRLVSARSPGDSIEEMFREYFGNTRLSRSLKPTMVTAFDLVLGVHSSLIPCRPRETIAPTFLCGRRRARLPQQLHISHRSGCLFRVVCFFLTVKSV
jgi:hypothetical protein